jgi:Cu/Ag efflux protein CusF
VQNTVQKACECKEDDARDGILKIQDFTSEEKDVTIKPGEMANLGTIEMSMTRGTFTKGDVSLPMAWKGIDQGPVLEGKQQK